MPKDRVVQQLDSQAGLAVHARAAVAHSMFFLHPILRLHVPARACVRVCMHVCRSLELFDWMFVSAWHLQVLMLAHMLCIDVASSAGGNLSSIFINALVQH